MCGNWKILRSHVATIKICCVRLALRYDELETVLCQVEAVINSRPLTYISSDDSSEPLTPFHLLFGRNVSIISSDVSSELKTAEAAKNHYAHLKRVLDGQWKIFSSSYINELRQQHIYRSSNATSASKFPSLGDVVLIKSDTPLPRQKWRIGKVEQLIRGRDGNVRGVKLVVSSNEGSRTVCHRPLQKIIPLEIVESLEPETVAREERPKRKAVAEGQILRRLRETFG